MEGVNPVTYPSYACKMEFPERPNKYVPAGKMPPVAVYWYEGTLAKKLQTSRRPDGRGHRGPQRNLRRHQGVHGHQRPWRELSTCFP